MHQLITIQIGTGKTLELISFKYVFLFKDRQQSIRPILVWSQYIGDWYVPPKILYTYKIPLRC